MYGVSVTADYSASLPRNGVRIYQQNAALLLMTLTATYYVLVTTYVHGGDQG